MVKTPTRGDNYILDAFITNVPNYWKKVIVAKSLVRSDHKMIIAYPRETVKAKRTDFYLPYRFWKEFGVELAPTVTKIFNSSLRRDKVPKVWKRADLIPVPKEATLENCDQLRPISLTDIIMRIFEKCIYKTEIAHFIRDIIDSDQFAYKGCHNTIMALIKCQHSSLKWLENGARYVRVFSFDFKKAFDSVPHDILCSKLKNLRLNPYIGNWIDNFLDGRHQRVKVDGTRTDYVNINRGVPQGTVLGPVLFSVMINDINTVNAQNELVKFADDLTLEVPGYDYGNTSMIEVSNIREWYEKNRMQLNMEKTYEMVMMSKISTPLPAAIPNIDRKSWLKILGITLENVPDKWIYILKK